MFRFIKVEKKKYPTIIMGEDKFSGWFYSDPYENEDQRAESYYKTLKIAYGLGVRGFSMSPHNTLIEALKKFKDQHPDIICIANPHYKRNYYLDGKSIWTDKTSKRLLKTIFDNYQNEFKNIDWFSGLEKYKPFSNEEVKNIYLDEKEYTETLEIFEEFCDFSLIGNICRSSLILLDRQELVKKESELVRKTKMIPILICEAGKLTLEKAKNIDCGGYWVKINEDFGVPNVDELVKYLKIIKKPITAYTAFSRKDGFDAKKSIGFFRKINRVKSLVVGVENEKQAKKTFTILDKIINKNL